MNLNLNDNRMRLLVAYCGGTFGMKPSPSGLEASQTIEPALRKLFAQHVDSRPGSAFSWDLWSPDCIIDSASSSPESMVDLARALHLASSGYDGLLVIHGTDTLSHISAFLSLTLAPEIPTVITGSQRSVFESKSDAAANFSLALDALVQAGQGVKVAFGGEIHEALNLTKIDAQNDIAFMNIQPAVHLNPAVTFHLGKETQDQATPRVGILPVFPGINAQTLAAMAEQYPDGLVLQCYGAGTAPTEQADLMETISRTVQQGTPIIAVTQCPRGAVELKRYSTGNRLAEAGVINGGYLTSETAWALLLAAKSAGTHNDVISEVVDRLIYIESKRSTLAVAARIANRHDGEGADHERHLVQGANASEERECCGNHHRRPA